MPASLGDDIPTRRCELREITVRSRRHQRRSERRGRFVTLIAAAGLGLAGCSVGPDYERPQTETPAAWLTAKQGPAAWPSADWWGGFGSTQLDEFIAEAERANYDLAAAVERVRQTDAHGRISR